MKKIWFLFLCLLMITISQGQDYRSPTIWENDIVVDGQTKEWKQPFGLSNASTGLSFSVANDSTHLYLAFEIREPLYLVKMLKAGWKLQLSSKERKKQFNANINFQPIFIEVRPKHDYVNVENKKKPTFNNWLDDYKLESTTYIAKGFKHASRNVLSIGDSLYHHFIHIGLDYTEEMAVYEIAIPLQELMTIDQINWSEKMHLKVFVNAVEAPTEDEKGKDNGHSGGGGRGGRGGSSGGGRDAAIESRAPKNLRGGVSPKILYTKANLGHEFYLVFDKK